MKGICKAITIASAIVFSSQAIIAAEEGVHAQGLHEELCEVGLKIKDEIKSVLKEYEGITQANEALKTAGGSYQHALTLGEPDLSVYTTKKQQTSMAGALTFDAGYAALFLRKKEMANFLSTRKALFDKIGIGRAPTPKMKAILENPDSLNDFSAWADAMDEAAAKLTEGRIVSDKELNTFVDFLYGMIVEGLYIVSESVALADYPPQMLELMNHQHERIDFFIKTLNTFRGDKAFEEAIAFDSRFDLIGDLHNLMVVSKFTQREVDGIRKIIAPERAAILAGKGR